MNIDQAREILIDHSRSKLNGQFPATSKFQSELTNPLCGDHVQIKFDVASDRISEIGFLTKACAICSASTSMMSHFVKGCSPTQALEISQLFEDSLLAKPSASWPLALESLRSFEHLKINQARRTCAILPWVALRTALKETL